MESLKIKDIILSTKAKLNIPISLVYEVTNVSNKIVVIKNLTSECGCTTPSISKNVIDPKETVYFTVTYNSGSLGNNLKSATFVTDGDEIYNVYLSINVEK